MATASTIPPEPPRSGRSRSLTLRMIGLAALWIGVLLAGGGFGLDRVLTNAITRNFDTQLDYAMIGMIGAADIGDGGEVRFLRALGDQRFVEPYSGLYWQVTAAQQQPFKSRSLWDRTLGPHPAGDCMTPCRYASKQFGGEPLRIVGRDVRLPGSPLLFHFQVAQSTRDLDEQIAKLRDILLWSLSALGAGLLILAGLQSTFGLWPLRRVSRAIAAIRSGTSRRVPDDFPREIGPLVTEINELLDHNEKQAEAARLHAGYLAHALKTPMSVLMGEVEGRSDSLALTVAQQVGMMRRHVDHQLARARATGRRGASTSRAEVWSSLEAITRTVARIHAGREVTIDLAGDKTKVFRGERQDLEEMAGNLIDNAALHGGGRVFITIGGDSGTVEILVEDDGAGIPAEDRAKLFARGERLDTDKPGTGLGLAIVRDVADIYGGTVELGESEDLGGLSVTLRLPAAG